MLCGIASVSRLGCYVLVATTPERKRRGERIEKNLTDPYRLLKAWIYNKGSV